MRKHSVKILFCYLIIFCSLFIVVEELTAYNWPFKQDEVFTNQQRIRATLGGYRENNRFHSGVDIAPNISVSSMVYTVASGQITYLSTDTIRVGNYAYVHLKPLEGFQLGANLGINKKLGYIIASYGTPHLHFIEGPAGSNKNNPLSSISNFVDSTPPTVDSFKIFKHGTDSEEISGTTNEITENVIYGKVDLRVKGYDKMDSTYQLTGVNDYYGKVMPYKLGYRILEFDSNEVKYDRISSSPTIIFNEVFYTPIPGNENVRLIHHGITGTDPEYWVTNETIQGAEPQNRAWNTKQKIGGGWDEDALINSQAQTPDGNYKVQVFLVDSENNANPTNMDNEKIRTIDNFRPYVLS